jgi:hypothetical protein
MWSAIRFVAGWFWRWEVVATGAVAVFISGGIGAIYGDDFILATCLFFLAIVWITAKSVSWSEVRGHKDRVWVSIVIVVLAVLCLWGSMNWIRQRAEDVAKKNQPVQQQTAAPAAGNPSPSSQQAPNEPEQEPPKAVLPPQKSNSSSHVPIPTATPKAPIPEGGNDNTTYGNVAPPASGSRNTFVGPTDDKGNTTIRGGTAVGANARAGPTSVAIGSGAGGGNMASPGVNAAPITQGDCGVVQNGGSGNVAAPTCAPPERKFSQQEHDHFVAALRSICPFSVAVRPITGNAESMKYADQIVQALRDAGCTPTRPKFLIDTAASYGITLVIHDKDNIPPGADATKNAFDAAKISVNGTATDIIEPNILYIMVGLQPAPQK